MDPNGEEIPPLPPVRNASAKEFEKPLPNVPPSDEKKKKVMGFKLFPQSKKKPEISLPTQFEHTVHVGFDPVTGEFTGMPEEWTKLLTVSNISPTEQKKNPQAVIDVLNFYDSSTKAKSEDTKFMTVNKGIGGSETTPAGQYTAEAKNKYYERADVPSSKTQQPPADESRQKDVPPAVPSRPEYTKSRYITADQLAGSQGKSVPQQQQQENDAK